MDRPHDPVPGSATGDRAERRAPEGPAADGLADVTDPTPKWSRTIAQARQARDLARALEARARFLSDAGQVLASSLDLETMLRSVARLAVPTLGDWCIVDVADVDGLERPVAVAGAEPEDADIARRLERAVPTRRATPCVASILHGSDAGLPPGTPPGLDAGDGPTLADTLPDRRAVLRELHVRAQLCVPLLARGRPLGALTLLATHSGRSYGPADLALAEELAQRAAMAMDNALLFGEAERAKAARAQFLSTMSHEFRTPLQAVMGFTELLLLGVPVPIPAAARAYAERIAGAAAHLLHLVNHVLEFARLDAGRETVRAEAVDVATFAREVVLLIEPLAQAKGLRFLVQAPAPGTTLVTDVGKLRQICYNLLANAVKFTERGEVTLVASAVDGRLQLEVRDTGVGIPAGHLVRIFEAFYQVERPAAGAPGGGGTGLGLSISQHLARLLGGELRADSVVGEGTTFTLTLPLAPPLAPPPPFDEYPGPGPFAPSV